MTRSFVFARLPLHTGAARDELAAIVAPVTAFANTSEPGVSKYATLVAREDANAHNAPTRPDVALYMMEEYDNQAAFDSHVATPGVQKFVGWLGTAGNVNGTPNVRFTVHTDLEWAAPEAVGVADPYIVVSTYEFPNGGAAAALDKFKAPFVAAKARGALLYGVYTDKDSTDVVLTAEAYRNSEGYVGPAVGGSVDTTMVLALKHGFLHKRRVKSSL